MTGVNLLGFMIGYAALIVLGLAILPAVGLLMFRRFRAALLTFATGALIAALIMVTSILTFLDPAFSHDQEPLIVLLALVFFMQGVGQFVAALRGLRTYAAVCGCIAGSMVFLILPAFDGSDFVGVHVGLDAIFIPLLIASALMATSGLIIAVFIPLRVRTKTPAA